MAGNMKGVCSLGDVLSKKEVIKLLLPGDGGDFIELNDGLHVAAGLIVWRMDGEEESKGREEFARRVVACVNACAGISTGDLESAPGYKSAVEGFHEQRKLVEQARNQRNHILTALNRLLSAVEFVEPNHDILTGSDAIACKKELRSAKAFAMAAIVSARSGDA